MLRPVSCCVVANATSFAYTRATLGASNLSFWYYNITAKMSFFGWCSRRIGGLSMVVLIIFCYWVISSESTLERHGYKFEHAESRTASYTSTSTTGAGIWTYVFAYYTLLVHLAIFIFPFRACYAIIDLSRAIIRNTGRRSFKDLKGQAPRRRGSYASVSSSETLISEHQGASTTASSEAGDIDMEVYTDCTDATVSSPVIHAIVIPNYKEEIDSLKETLEVLACHPQAQTCYDVSTTWWLKPVFTLLCPAPPLLLLWGALFYFRSPSGRRREMKQPPSR